MRKSLQLLFLGMLLSTGAAYAQNSLNVILRDGGAVTYSFQEKPVVTYTQTGVHLTTASVEVDFPFDNLEKFTFDDDTADALLQVRTDGIASDTRIYTLGGVLVRTVKAAEGTAGFSLDDLPKGVYIIKNGKTTHKISKK